MGTGSPLINNFRYEDVFPPIVLEGGEQYVVISYAGLNNSTDYCFYLGSASTSYGSAISFIDNVWHINSTIFEYPDQTSGSQSDGDFGSNFFYERYTPPIPTVSQWV